MTSCHLAMSPPVMLTSRPHFFLPAFTIFPWFSSYGTGSMVAGGMMDSLGTRKLFAVFSACSLATLVLYFGYVNILVHVQSNISNDND